MYFYYKQARNAALRTLLDCGIRSPPVDLNIVADYYNFKIVTYSDSGFMPLFRDTVLKGDGFIVDLNNKKHIFINDHINNRNRRRFTLSHEIGHGVLNHDIGKIHYRNSEIDSKTDVNEMQANVFARDLLMPATVLHALNIHTTEEIMELCHISRQSAEIRAKRMVELYQRNMFNKNPLEQQVREQFDDFIKSKKQ